jgi:hypothetical protein
MCQAFRGTVAILGGRFEQNSAGVGAGGQVQGLGRGAVGLIDR